MSRTFGQNYYHSTVAYKSFSRMSSLPILTECECRRFVGCTRVQRIITSYIEFVLIEFEYVFNTLKHGTRYLFRKHYILWKCHLYDKYWVDQNPSFLFDTSIKCPLNDYAVVYTFDKVRVLGGIKVFDTWNNWNNWMLRLISSEDKFLNPKMGKVSFQMKINKNTHNIVASLQRSVDCLSN